MAKSVQCITELCHKKTIKLYSNSKCAEPLNYSHKNNTINTRIMYNSAIEKHWEDCATVQAGLGLLCMYIHV